MSNQDGNRNHERHKRLAAQLLSQLPETKEEALIVLAITRQLVEWIGEGEQLSAAVLRIVG